MSREEFSLELLWPQKTVTSVDYPDDDLIQLHCNELKEGILDTDFSKHKTTKTMAMYHWCSIFLGNYRNKWIRIELKRPTLSESRRVRHYKCETQRYPFSAWCWSVSFGSGVSNVWQMSIRWQWSRSSLKRSPRLFYLKYSSALLVSCLWILYHLSFEYQSLASVF